MKDICSQKSVGKGNSLTLTVLDLEPLVQVYKPKFENLYSIVILLKAIHQFKGQGIFFQIKQILLKRVNCLYTRVCS